MQTPEETLIELLRQVGSIRAQKLGNQANLASVTSQLKVIPETDSRFVLILRRQRDYLQHANYLLACEIELTKAIKDLVSQL